jgi:hypothetical protein
MFVMSKLTFVPGHGCHGEPGNEHGEAMACRSLKPWESTSNIPNMAIACISLASIRSIQIFFMIYIHLPWGQKKKRESIQGKHCHIEQKYGTSAMDGQWQCIPAQLSNDGGVCDVGSEASERPRRHGQKTTVSRNIPSGYD